MSAAYHIRYVRRQEIDIAKWEDCITRSPNGLVYAYSFYLDTMADHWDALVLDDYRAVMPLPWRKKWMIHYLYQPFLTAQLGVFGENLSEEMVGAFVAAIPAKFKLVEISLNARNIFSIPTGFDYLRDNYVLDLSRSYEQLQARYRENIRRNVKKALQAGCTAIKDFDETKVVELAIQQMRSYGEESADNVARFKKLYRLLREKNMAITYGILSPKQELIASCVFFFSHNRAYYILVGNHPDGRTLGASHALIDAFIKDHAGKPMILDFEGSDIRNLAFFYSSFGAEREVYPSLRLNRLPFFVRLFKG